MKKNIGEGISLYKKKFYEEAFSFFYEFEPTTEDESQDCIYYLGLLCVRLNRSEEAIDFLEQVVTSGLNEKRVLQCRLILAVLYTSSGRHKMAQFEIQQLLNAGHETTQVYDVLAYLCWVMDDKTEAIKNYEAALKLNGENSTALNGLGYVLACESKDLTRALMYCKKALDKNPESPAYLDSLGWVYYKLGLFTEAHDLLKRAKNLDTLGLPEIEEHYRIIQNEMNNDKSSYLSRGK